MPMFMLNGKQYGGNGGNYQVAKMSKADYDALTTEQKNDGTLRIVVDTAGNSVNYMSAQVAGAKTDDTLTNLLNPILATSTINGVTYTANGDGSYTLNGTATAFTDVRLSPWGTAQYSDCLALKPGKYKLTGTPESYSTLNAHVGLVPNNGVERPTSYYDEGNGYILNHTDESIRYEYKISVNQGAVFNNTIFKPMLTTDLSASYDDFVGYTGGTGRLNSDVAEHEKEISRINSDLTELSSKTPLIIEVNKTVTLNPSSPSQYVTATVDFSSDIPSGKNYEILSARGGIYPLPYHSAEFAQHTWISDISQNSKTIEIKSNAKWQNYGFTFAILIH